MKHTLLCVDDEPDIVDSLERLFRSKYRVLKATSAQQALDILAREKVSVIISDQRMPGMTGVELLAHSIESSPDAIRVLLTGYTDVEAVIAAVNSGQIYRYVSKPWDPRELASAVDRAVERFDLQIELKTKNQQLEKAIEDLRALDKAKDQFMILINHELKTPLTSLISYLDLLRETQLNSEQILFIERIATSCQRLKEIIFDVLELMSAQTGRTKISVEVQKVRKLVDTALEPLSKILAKNRQRVQMQIEDVDLVCDGRLVTNVLKRLLHNAAKFSAADAEIQIRVFKKGTSFVFEVQNPAAPLAADVKERVLKPFTINEEIMNHSRGMGLGLSVSNELLKLHGSHIEFPEDPHGVSVRFMINP